MKKLFKTLLGLFIIANTPTFAKEKNNSFKLEGTSIAETGKFDYKATYRGKYRIGDIQIKGSLGLKNFYLQKFGDFYKHDWFKHTYNEGSIGISHNDFFKHCKHLSLLLSKKREKEEASITIGEISFLSNYSITIGGNLNKSTEKKLSLNDNQNKEPPPSLANDNKKINPNNTPLLQTANRNQNYDTQDEDRNNYGLGSNTASLPLTSLSNWGNNQDNEMSHPQPTVNDNQNNQDNEMSHPQPTVNDNQNNQHSTQNTNSQNDSPSRNPIENKDKVADADDDNEEKGKIFLKIKKENFYQKDSTFTLFTEITVKNEQSEQSKQSKQSKDTKYITDYITDYIAEYITESRISFSYNTKNTPLKELGYSYSYSYLDNPIKHPNKLWTTFDVGKYKGFKIIGCYNLNKENKSSTLEFELPLKYKDPTTGISLSLAVKPTLIYNNSPEKPQYSIPIEFKIEWEIL